MGLHKEYPEWFEMFVWRPYPRHEGKDQAFREAKKLGFSNDQWIEFKQHIEQRKRFDVRWLPNKEGNVFIPHLERFLKHRRFEDEYERISTKPVVPTTGRADSDDLAYRRLGYSSADEYVKGFWTKHPH